jgi:hypothetical protein
MFAQEAISGEFAHWGLGTHENEYVKQDGVWKIRSLHQYTTMYTPYEDGWGVTALPLRRGVLRGPAAWLNSSHPTHDQSAGNVRLLRSARQQVPGSYARGGHRPTDNGRLPPGLKK